ncbi:MAG TPA: hypothetical protein PK788_08440 [Gemmatimonadaceae bacterium]|nr:hypothetical protein [Gemmatimonadaceae bacterium]
MLGLAVALAAPARAQVNCTVNNQNSCTAGGANTAINITISRVARLTSPSGTLTLPQPNVNQFDAGFGNPLNVTLNVRANGNWALAIRAGQNTWTATPGTARQDKPVGDLQWSTSGSGPFTNMSTSLVSLASGGATASASPPLFLRARFAWASDRPGNYSIPVQIVLTTP